MENRYVYSFNEGSKDMVALLGIKGANLSQMTQTGLPVPFGFTVTTEVCSSFYNSNMELNQEIRDAIRAKMTELEYVEGKSFGDSNNPLLVSVRSGASVSMPGMMDTVLNLGINDRIVEGLAKKSGNPRFAYDCYRRFIHMFGNIVSKIPEESFAAAEDKVLKECGAHRPEKLDAEQLKLLVQAFKTVYLVETGKPLPEDPYEQLFEAIKAVFKSWNNDRAVLYREIEDISHSLGTAVNVQAMVFGNMDQHSGTGVAFTRSPADGEKKVYGEFLINAQGDDVVAGTGTPDSIEKLKVLFPELYSDFQNICHMMEQQYCDMQDIEFTIQQGRLYLLQTREGKRTADAAVRIAVDMVEEGLIDREKAILMLNPVQVEQLLNYHFKEEALAQAKCVARGLSASPGAACGRLVFNAEDAEKMHSLGEPVILVREETSPEDLAGIVASEGILTLKGGMTSHAAVVTRAMGKCCVAGCSDARIHEESRRLILRSMVFDEGDMISLDGKTGNVYPGAIEKVKPEISGDFKTIMSWADGMRRMKVKANADTIEEIDEAMKFGAEGIGLCRTEYMFTTEERILDIRRIILSDRIEVRREALKCICSYQKEDFKKIFAAVRDETVTIRLLDIPFFRFLPDSPAEIRKLAEQLQMSYIDVAEKIWILHETNPMMGHRGARLLVSNPEVVKMQTRAILSAAIEVSQEEEIVIQPEIMVPMVGLKNEIAYIKKIVQETADRVRAKYDSDLDLHLGTMIEVPRAALRADEIAEEVDFFSFGTNDLTQLIFGFSRDDAEEVIDDYIDKGLLRKNVFQSIDRKGVGRFIEMAVELGRQTKSNLKMGVCGEHGSDPRSIAYFDGLGINYVSCSPYMVPVARLAAAQSTLRSKNL